MRLLKLKFSRPAAYSGDYVVRFYRATNPDELEIEVPLSHPLPADIFSATNVVFAEDYIYKIYATACGSAGTLVGQGVAKYTENTCIPPTVNNTVVEGNKLSIFFSNLEVKPLNGFRLRYRIKESSGAFLDAPGRFKNSPAVVVGLIPGVTYEWEFAGDCGNDKYSLPIVGEVNT